jgi:hypothetical protein
MASTLVPLNTMLADLDESIRTMLKRDLDRHGFDGVEIVFDAPSKEWSATLSSPTVDCFLYDLREAVDRRPTDWYADGGNGRREIRPPMRLDASYAVTAWTRAVEDEHRLLSQVLAVFYAYPDLPDDVLTGTLADKLAQRYPLTTRVAQSKQDKADFWTSIGGQYKASVDYVVTVSCESGTYIERGPEVRTQTMRILDKETRALMLELHRIGGRVLDGDSEPVANAWVVLSGAGWTATDDEGRFFFQNVPPGTYDCTARGPDGTEASASIEVPGGMLDLTLGTGSKKPAKRRS